MSRLAVILDALAQAGARVVITLDLGARWLEARNRPQEDTHNAR